MSLSTPSPATSVKSQAEFEAMLWEYVRRFHPNAESICLTVREGDVIVGAARFDSVLPTVVRMGCAGAEAAASAVDS